MHFYIDGFYASLEQLRDSKLVGMPVVVTHNSGRGEIVVSASSEAAAKGVRESMTIRHAGRYCPDAVFLHADWETYKEASDGAMDILANYSPLLEPHSLDKAYLDVTGCFSLFGSPKSIASEAQRKVVKEIGVPMAVGISRNKLISSAASSAGKPDRCLMIRPGSEQDFLRPLPVGYLSGVGEKVEKRLFDLGVRTVGDLSAIPERLLMRQFGVMGSRLHKLSLGIDNSRVIALYPPATISTEHTFYEEVCEPDLIEPHLLRICDRLAIKLRERNQQAGVVTIRLEFEGFPAAARSYTFKTPISSTHGIYAGAGRILRQVMQGAGIRSLRLTLNSLDSGGGIQLSFGGDVERRMKLDAVLQSIRARFGEHSITCGVA
jgi:DNA polymerase-4